jgi:aspartate beta-hydroxylase
MSMIVDQGADRLIEAATRAFAEGRGRDAERYLQQAQTLAPNHPMVLNEVARRKLFENDPEAAYGLLQEATRTEIAHADLWMTLAAAAHALGRHEAERAALEKVLALEPRNLRALLQMAGFHEARGDPRAAAASYRTALSSIPRGVDLHPEMLAHIQHGREVVEANNLALESFLQARLEGVRADHPDQPTKRFDRCMDTLLQKQRIFRQQPTFMYFPQLPSIEFYERSDFPWLDRIEAAADDIRAEFLDVFTEDKAALEPYVQGMPHDAWRELNNSRRWSVYYLWKAGEAVPENMARCPRTVAALEAWPKCDLPGSGPSAVFSLLDARSRIPPHTGVNNTRLIVHLPLIVPEGCGFRVGGETRAWEPGKAFVFDDTIEHEAWNDSDAPRAVMIFDIWNPLVTLAEREMVKALTAGVADFYGTLPAYV